MRHGRPWTRSSHSSSPWSVPAASSRPAPPSQRSSTSAATRTATARTPPTRCSGRTGWGCGWRAVGRRWLTPLSIGGRKWIERTGRPMPGCGVLSEEFVARCVERLRRDVPDAVAIRFGGSQLHGDAGPYSDVDFDVWVPEGPRDEWPSWLDSDGGRLVRVSSWIRDVDAWLADRGEPQAWAFCLPCADRARLCWYADESWRERVTSAESTFPAGPPEIDHFEGYAGKVANAWHAGDELALRLAAQDLAGSVISVLQPLN